ncbi:hypothetical protein D3C79_1109530 [compost metagenome]
MRRQLIQLAYFEPDMHNLFFIVMTHFVGIVSIGNKKRYDGAEYGNNNKYDNDADV